MSINEALQNQGWELTQLLQWVAVKDQRPEFRTAFKTDRVGKIVDGNFYVTLQPLTEITQDLIRQIGCAPIAIQSTKGSREALYWGFVAAGVSEDNLSTFTSRLANEISEVI